MSKGTQTENNREPLLRRNMRYKVENINWSQIIETFHCQVKDIL